MATVLRNALDKLKATVQGDTGKHLRESGRHAIAHAQADPIINPDDPRDARQKWLAAWDKFTGNREQAEASAG
jgi:hypothetical protein